MVSKKEFASVVKEPFAKAFSMTNIKAGFKKCGIFPFNPDVMIKLSSSEMYSPVSESSLNSSTAVVDDTPKESSNDSEDDDHPSTTPHMPDDK